MNAVVQDRMNHTIKILLVSLQPLIVKNQYHNTFTYFTANQTLLLSLSKFSSATLGGIND